MMSFFFMSFEHTPAPSSQQLPLFLYNARQCSGLLRILVQCSEFECILVWASIVKYSQTCQTLDQVSSQGDYLQAFECLDVLDVRVRINKVDTSLDSWALNPW